MRTRPPPSKSCPDFTSVQYTLSLPLSLGSLLPPSILFPRLLPTISFTHPSPLPLLSVYTLHTTTMCFEGTRSQLGNTHKRITDSGWYGPHPLPSSSSVSDPVHLEGPKSEVYVEGSADPIPVTLYWVRQLVETSSSLVNQEPGRRCKGTTSTVSTGSLDSEGLGSEGPLRTVGRVEGDGSSDGRVPSVGHTQYGSCLGGPDFGQGSPFQTYTFYVVRR